MPRKPPPRESPVSLRLTDEEARWIESQRTAEETVGAAVKRVWRVGRLVLESDDPVGTLADRIRRAREALGE